ncbi:hypothetical protein BC828DRAFT_384211 [Blastocladiella britannica]|nr:hypothetical protein BC828DRAFT_384211 [Blastocladiella britannica]
MSFSFFYFFFIQLWFQSRRLGRGSLLPRTRIHLHYDDLTTTCRASRYRPDRRSNLLMSLLVACNSPAYVPGLTTSAAAGGVGWPAISDWRDTGFVVVERVPVVMVSGMCWANVKNRSRSRCKAADDSGAVGTGNPVSVHRAARSNDASFLVALALVVVGRSKARTDGCDGEGCKRGCKAALVEYNARRAMVVVITMIFDNKKI